MKRIIVGITGASGAPLAITLLKMLSDIPDVETHVVLTDGARRSIPYESDMTPEAIEALADVAYSQDEIAAPIASGTFLAHAMIVVPCSMKTVAGIANGFADNLLLRAADVTIKEHRTLVLVPREAPMSPIHLRNLHELSLIPSVRIVPEVMSYYMRPTSIEDMERHLVGKIFDQIGLKAPDFKRWGNA